MTDAKNNAPDSSVLQVIESYIEINSKSSKKHAVIWCSAWCFSWISLITLFYYGLKLINFGEYALPVRYIPFRKNYETFISQISQKPLQFFLLTFTVQILIMWLTYWISGIAYIFLDQIQLFRRFKVQQDTPSCQSVMDFLKVARVALKNQLVVAAPLYASFAAVRIFLFQRDESVPAWGTLFIQYAAMSLIGEVVFYYTHRLLHHPSFYKQYHKLHHSYSSPFSITPNYCTTFEHVLNSTLPIGLGPLLIGPPLFFYWFWFFMLVLDSVTTHSGYHFPLLNSPQFHDFHHVKSNVNFGSLGLLDRLHGTDELFMKSVNSKRHRFFFSLMPVHEIVPDDKNINEKTESEDTSSALPSDNKAEEIRLH